MKSYYIWLDTEDINGDKARMEYYKDKNVTMHYSPWLGSMLLQKASLSITESTIMAYLKRLWNPILGNVMRMSGSGT